MASRVEIIFNENMRDNLIIRLYPNFYLGTAGLHRFVNQRVRSGEVTIGDTLDQTIDNYFQALRVDINASGAFSIIRLEDGISIVTREDGVFDNIALSSGNDIPQDNEVTFNISQVSSVILLRIADVEYLPSLVDPCNNVRVKVITTKTFKNLTAPVTINDVNSDEVIFEHPRGINYNIGIQEGNIGGFLFRGFRTPNPILVSDFIVSVNANPNGFILSIENTAMSTDNRVSYSIDGVNYSASGIFDGLLPDTYTIYVQDSFDCVKTFDYTIEDMNVGESTAAPYIHYPYANPIPMVRVKNLPVGDNYGVGDLISRDELNDVTSSFLQPFLNTDNPTLQVHSSFSYVEFQTINEQREVVDTNIATRSIQNINVFDSRDGVIYTDNDGVLRLYFTTGNTYNEFGEVIIDEGHALAGLLPSFYRVGVFINVNGTFEQITAIEFNDEFDRTEVITSSRPLQSINDSVIIVSTFYNQQPYDVYEASLSMDLPDDKYQVVMRYGFNSDQIRGEFRSEFVEVLNSVPNHHLIKYWSIGNKGIIYNQGFFGTIRVYHDNLPKDVTTTESEQYQADDRLVSIYDDILEVYEFDFGFIPSNYKKQLINVLMNDVVFIDGIQFKKTGDFESERVGISNYYSFKATMQRQYDRVYREDQYNISELITNPFPVGRFIVSNNSFIDSNGLIIN